MHVRIARRWIRSYDGALAQLWRVFGTTVAKKRKEDAAGVRERSICGQIAPTKGTNRPLPGWFWRAVTKFWNR
jgi:hypothetical protein